MFNRDTKSGFTLVEILVVLAIIGVLAALLFPVFSRVREEAHRATCQSNLQQIGLAIGQYKQDSSGLYPPASTQVNHKQLSWRDLLAPYTTDRQLFFCPSQPEPLWYDYGFTSVNTWVFTPTKVTITGKNEAALKAEASTVILTDSTRLWTTEQADMGATSAPTREVYLSASCDVFGPSDRGGSTYLPTVHADGANYGFADGHVKWFTPVGLLGQYCSSKFSSSD